MKFGKALSRLAALLPVIAIAGGMMSASAPAAAQRSPAAEAELCKTCHAEYVETFLQTKHGQAGNVMGPSCQTCHGDGTEHAKAGGGKGVGGILGFDNKAVSAERKSGVCQTCHKSNRHLAFWDSGRHAQNEVACSDCHSLHGKPGPGSTIALKNPNPSVSPYQTTSRQLQYETCTTCHKQIRSQLLKPSHHPIIEGRIACTDCHNPHGALSRAMVKAESIPQLCTSCHSEKRGPWIWGHPPVEENCLTCHNPHGANHARLLQEKPPNVCQDCHDAGRHPGTVYDASGSWLGSQNNRLLARGCVNCHNRIHGSNAPAAQGKFFLR